MLESMITAWILCGIAMLMLYRAMLKAEGLRAYADRRRDEAIDALCELGGARNRLAAAERRIAEWQEASGYDTPADMNAPRPQDGWVKPGYVVDDVPVVCERCHSKYLQVGAPRPEGSKPKQGASCCAWSWEKDGRWYITGGYGSTACDMSTLEWTIDKPIEPDPTKPDGGYRWRHFQPRKLDVICDACIANLFVNGCVTATGRRGEP